jgi:hypothetical protein
MELTYGQVPLLSEPWPALGTRRQRFPRARASLPLRPMELSSGASPLPPLSPRSL